jgi:hypothetical protein
MLKKYRKIIIFVLVVILSFVLYTIFLKPQTDQALLQKSGPTEVDTVGQEIIDTLNRVQSIKVDKSVFNDPLYLRLRDDSRPINDQEKERENPFAPLEGTITGVDIQLELSDGENSDNENVESEDTEPEVQVNNEQ